jgi:hypothetical protein
MRMKKTLLFLALTTLCSGAEWKQLFNGKDLTGWKMTGPGRFVIEDGLMKTEGGMGLLYYEPEKFGNTTIRVVFKTMTPEANSGVIIRLPEHPRDPWYGVHNGFEVQIAGTGDEWHRTGSIYSLSKAEANQKPVGEWNTMEIQLKGQHTIMTLNGKVVGSFDGKFDNVPPRKQWYEPVRGPRPDVGYIGLQNHDPQSIVYFREVSVKK